MHAYIHRGTKTETPTQSIIIIEYDFELKSNLGSFIYRKNLKLTEQLHTKLSWPYTKYKTLYFRRSISIELTTKFKNIVRKLRTCLKQRSEYESFKCWYSDVSFALFTFSRVFPGRHNTSAAFSPPPPGHFLIIVYTISLSDSTLSSQNAICNRPIKHH